MDIRNPKLGALFRYRTRLDELFSIQGFENTDLIVKYEGYEDLHASSRNIPPNPAELLMSGKVDTLFNDLKAHYDYIVVDTAPVSLVTDTLLLLNMQIVLYM
jgi:Mrp family chromosome partitioning ATPase